MAPQLKKTAVMVGMMGAGKTAVGRALAHRLGVAFLDSDAEIEAAANMSVPEIFARDGEAFFRDRESRVIARLLDGPRGVLSTGGGAFLDAGNRAMIAERAVSVWLDVDLDLLWDRVRHRTTRPLLQTADPYASLAALFETRVPIYALADVHVTAEPGRTIEQTARRVAAALAARPGILREGALP